MNRITVVAAALLAAGCSTTPPSGPSILVLPGSSKTFDQFRFDEQECRNYARDRFLANAESINDAGSPQRRYDNAFTQCMYAKGHRVPVAGRYADEAGTQSAARVPPPPPPPPAGQPPAEAPPDYRPK